MDLLLCAAKYALYGGPTSEWLIRSDGYAISINSQTLEVPPDPVMDVIFPAEQVRVRIKVGADEMPVSQSDNDLRQALDTENTALPLPLKPASNKGK